MAVIEIQKDDAIKRSQIFFDFMLRRFNNLNQLYEKGKSLLIYTILTYKSRNESAKENKSNPSPKKVVLWMIQTKQIKGKVTPTNQIQIFKKGACSEASNSEEEDVGMRKSRRKSDLSIKTKNQMEKILKRKRLNYLSVVKKVTLKFK